MPLYKKEDILSATNDGLDIICHYFPEAREAAEKKTKFKMHTEDTPSTSIRKKNGVYRVCDFGDERKEMDAFALAMMKENCESFGKLLQLLGQRHGVAGTDGSTPSSFQYEQREATADEPDGEYYYKVRDEFQEWELKTLGRFVKEEHCKALKCNALEEYTYIKNRKAHIFKSTEAYPQFLFDWGEFKKLYKPKEKDKKHRFIYIGKKPKDFIFGMDNVKRMCLEYQKNQERKQVRGVADDTKIVGDNDDDDEDQDERGAAPLLPEIVLASGDRDAINALSCGYPVVWKDSETTMLTGAQYAEIKKFCVRIVNIPDIDETGVRKARELGLKFLEIATAWLPRELKNYTDFRGNPCKDLTDYLWHFTSWNVERIISSAVCFKPWDEVKTKKSFEYVINNAQCYEFLYANGFHRIEKKNEKSGFVFIRVKKNVVEEIKPVVIKSFIHDWLKSNGYGARLRNVFYRTTQLNETGLNGNLDVAEFDFTDHDKESQLLYFKNEVVKITANGYEPTKSGTNHVWADEIINHDFKKTDPFFTWHIENEKVFLDSADESFSMVKFIMNTSKVFWRREKDGTITPEQIEIHKQHFLTKCFILGYLMFRFKNPSAPWAPFAVDSRDGSIGEANGGSGKSIFMQIPTHYMTSVILNGRDDKLTENKHIFEQVTEKTDYVLVDDCTGNVNFHFFFNFLTGNFVVNPKHTQSFSIPFHQSPKIGFSSNDMLRRIDPSTERRLIYCVFADYYHKKDGKMYMDDCIPSTEFEKNLIIDYTPEEMNQLSNFLMQCVQFFMVLMSQKKPIKQDPPMENVERRILRQKIGENFLDWASNYFYIPADSLDDGGHVDCEVKRKEMYDAYQDEYHDKFTKPKSFKEKINAFCQYKGWVLNPEERCTDKEMHKITRKIDGMTQEVFYIDTQRNVNPPAPQPTEDLSVQNDLDL